METINLIEFIKNGEIFEKMDKGFEQIVSDFDFGKLENFVHIKSFTDFKIINQKKKTLFILDHLLLDNVIDYLKDITEYSILDLNFGSIGFSKKIGISQVGILQLVALGIEIYEPFDLSSFLSNLDSSRKKYFRINNFDLPENLRDIYDNTDMVSLEEYGFEGGNFAIITTGSMLIEVLRLGELLQADGLEFQIFILNRLDKLESSTFGNIKNLIFIFDGLNFKYEYLIKKVFGDKNLKFITPKYNKLSTILDDYIMENLEFDAQSLKNRLKKSGIEGL
ncbi:MAG TPA: hypothetical protein PK674_01990 [Candidatus Absconditabacterales bacterium]|nr:hypothetical protein [Candidatus Absconditabacterales bacterium]HOQ79274.1 hypothetical protein [Candidatus Absconditabacterales bacterium]HPK28288.1 hypothetical protein [Candidatus Absconditabacterales bacterium]